MKGLIWFLCIFAYLVFAPASGEIGLIPALASFGGTIWLAHILCKKWDAHKKPNKSEATPKYNVSKLVPKYDPVPPEHRIVQSNPYNPSYEFEKAVRWESHYNGRFGAASFVRDRLGCSLPDAQAYVENIELGIPADNPFSELASLARQEAVKEEDVSSVDGMDGHAFEHYCAQLLKKSGFTDVNVTPASGDQGVDIIATKDDIKYAIQCKNYATPLGNTPIQEVNAGKVFYKCHVGVVMTNSTFTPRAKELAQATGVLLWDRERLQKMIKKTCGQ